MDVHKINEINQRTYDRIARDYGKRNPVHFWIKEFSTFSKLIEGKSVIDLGCGAGRDAEEFVKNGFDYMGLDLSDGMLEVARLRVPNAKFIQKSYLETDFPDNSFDGFWAAASFLHMPKKDLPHALREAKRIIKPGGIGFISVKENTGVNEVLINEGRYSGAQRYFSFFDSKEFKNLLEKEGFSFIKSGTHTEKDHRGTKWLTFFVKKK